MKKFHNINLLLDKLNIPLVDQLNTAIKQRKVRNIYKFIPKKYKNESLARYAYRLFLNSVSFQFVKVINNGVANYVAFGVPGPIITAQGKFISISAQVVNGRWGIHHILIYPDIDVVLESKSILLRMDSGCISGQLFGDQTCDCKQQYETALGLCIKNGSGLVMNIPGHDGRGWMEFKMANQQLMDECNLNTVEAANMFYQNHDVIDQRTYTEAVLILKALGFGKNHNFQLATNNPRKIGALNAMGMNLKKITNVSVQDVNPILRKNLLAKSKEWHHKIHIAYK